MTLAPGHTLVPGSEEHDGVCSALDVTSGRIEQQCRTDVCAPENARDSLIPNNRFVGGKRIISGLRIVGSIERGGLGPWGCGLRSEAGYGCQAMLCSVSLVHCNRSLIVAIV